MREEPRSYKVLVMTLTHPVFLLNQQPNTIHLFVPEDSATVLGTVKDEEGRVVIKQQQLDSSHLLQRLIAFLLKSLKPSILGPVV